MPSTAPEALKAEILSLVERYHAEAQLRTGKADRAADKDGDSSPTLVSLVSTLLDCEFQTGLETVGNFEAALAHQFGTRNALLVDSGSSANRLALTALTSPRMGRLRLKPGDEVITPAIGSPSLAAAIAQCGFVPVFADIALPAFNIDCRQLQCLLSPRTRAIAVPHLFGNPCDLDAITLFASFNNLLLIEDGRAAAGALFGGRPIGCFGQFASLSFGVGRYQWQQTAGGGGGALLASTPLYRSIAQGFRDEAGTRMRCSELQAALGLAQLGTLSTVIEARATAVATIVEGLTREFSGVLIFPEVLPAASPSWNSLPLAVRESAAPFTRDQLVAALMAAGIFCRPMATAAGSLPDSQQAQKGQAPPLRQAEFCVRQGLLLDLTPVVVAGAAAVQAFAGRFADCVNALGRR